MHQRQRNAATSRGRGLGARIVAGATAALITTIAALLASGSFAGSAGASTTPLKAVAGWLPGLAKATKLAAPASSRVLEIGVGISRPDTAAEVKLCSTRSTTRRAPNTTIS